MDNYTITQLYHKYCFLLENYAKTILTGKFNNYIDDCIQNVFLNLINLKKDKFISFTSSDIKNYLVKMLKNQAINLIKKENKYNTIPLSNINESTFKNNYFGNSITNYVDYKTLFEYIKKLKPIYRITLTYKYIIGYADEEIAFILNIKLKTVKMRLYRGKKCLYKIIYNK